MSNLTSPEPVDPDLVANEVASLGRFAVPGLAQGAKAPPVTPSERWFYGLGAVSSGVISNGISFFLLFYYNQVLGLPGSYAGAAIMIALLVDAITDPIVGVWSDKTRSRWGRRHPFMYASAIPITLTYLLIWHPPELSDFGLFVYLAIVTTGLNFFLTLFDIPSAALLAELTEDYDERTRLAGARSVMGWVGGLGMAFVMWGFFIATWGELNKITYQRAGFLAAGLAFLAITVSSTALHKRIPHLRKPPQSDSPATIAVLSKQIRLTLSNRNFLALFCAAIFAAMTVGVKGNFETFIMLHFWEFAPEQIQWIFAALVASALLAGVLAPWVTGHFDKKDSALAIYSASIIVSGLPYILRLIDFFPANDSPYLYPTIIIHQIIDVTLLIMAVIILSSMLADVVEENELSTGRREEGLFFAASAFSAKITMGFGILFAGAALDFIQFPEAAAPGDVDPDIIWNLGFIFGPAMMVFYCMAVGAITFYRISRHDHDQRLKALSDS